jgi:hypothetical protein
VYGITPFWKYAAIAKTWAKAEIYIQKEVDMLLMM